MSRLSSGDLYSMILYCRKILPIFFWIFTCFSFFDSTHQSALAFWKADVSESNSRYSASSPKLNLAVPRQMQDAIGFSHRLCSITFPLYDNRMCGIFQCVQAIFPIENTGQDAVIIHVTIHMH